MSFQASSPCILTQQVVLPCGLAVPNRLVKAATSEHFSDVDGNPNALHVKLYSLWARGGAGLLVTGNATVDREHLEGTGNVVVDESTDCVALKAWAASVEGTPARILLQLVHPGALSLSSQPIAPSALYPARLRQHFARPSALLAQDIEAIIQRFAAAAGLAWQCGFHGVQIHAAHGFLINQFLSPRTNKRTDVWGGSLQNRMRILIETIRAVRHAVTPSFLVAVKLNAADYVRGGFSQRESLHVLHALDSEEVDLIEISGGSCEKPAMWMTPPPSRFGEGVFSQYASLARPQLRRAALLITGGFRSAIGMTSAVSQAGCDLVGMARHVILEPDLPRRLLEGRAAAACPLPDKRGTGVFDELAWFCTRLRLLVEPSRLVPFSRV